MNGATASDFYERFDVDDIKNTPNSPQRTVIKATSELGTLRVDKVTHPSFAACRIDLDFKYNTLMEATENTDKVAFYMLDYGRGGIPTFGDQEYSGSVTGGECYLAYNPSLNELHRFDAQQAKPYYVEIDSNYFSTLLGNPQDKILETLQNKIARREFFGMKTNRLFPAHARIISDMYDCPLDGSLGNLMIEGSLHQFVGVQLASFIQSPSSTQRRENLISRDKEILYALKEYLTTNFQQNHSLLDLSRQFGINQNKLKKQFKELFGVPVIEYLYNMKMEQARLLLYEEKMFVSEVAPFVGYRNPNHFATAFKRKFGVNPSRVKVEKFND